jgi:hypothetical protein
VGQKYSCPIHPGHNTNGPTDVEVDPFLYTHGSDVGWFDSVYSVIFILDHVAQVDYLPHSYMAVLLMAFPTDA